MLIGEKWKRCPPALMRTKAGRALVKARLKEREQMIAEMKRRAKR